MSDTEIETALSAFIVLSAHLYLLLRKYKKPRQRRWWMTTHHKTRNQYDGTRLLSNLIQEPSGQFDNFCRMSSIDFEYLLQLIGPRIKKQDAVFRDSIPSKVRLAVAIVHAGDDFVDEEAILARSTHSLRVAFVATELRKAPTCGQIACVGADSFDETDTRRPTTNARTNVGTNAIF
ncbi:uncharacterized protein LOC123658370 [Melitaea cinxia]|uniref:uncharacterized protein LOC123658370 n=1 Tax=Melitaea cinxia TaxID=113334 RepID=UPI001E271355|nr:uncharacterized protein LOC123658370 [Melitaea cinxia]